MKNYDKEIALLAMRPHDFSPVDIIGKTGNGKSTFLENFAKRRRTFYKPAFSDWKKDECIKIFNAREIAKSIIESISNRDPEAWRNLFLAYDVVAIDDFDVFAGRPSMQEELFSYFLVCNKAIIVTTASEIRVPDFSDALVSFFSSGAHIHLEDPDKKSKLEVLQDQLSLQTFTVTEDALLWLAEQEFISFASIKGFIKTLQLFETDTAYTLEDCKRLAKSYIK